MPGLLPAKRVSPAKHLLQNVRVRRKDDLAALPAVQREIQSAEAALEGRGRVLVRYSGTEPLARIMIEGPDEGKIYALAEKIGAAIQAAIG